ncbi:MAG: Sigma 54 modulation protein/ribosomal protein S30EA [candidate division WS6 bacterium GW2011_GWE1_34_7]|uniref:Sigma 54 modulation protein/ribosomal protein S30EA n=1 Tax=candidate division WS6 bacterium GW2011_GWE1_34_7 TaxID=1619093 RepID=A0A0G0B3S1_9BACT|nr:MAG: Sigma 54 modulation protein/ribosomal protein S30EA [candidate division WS6 bacterium GW2011_GWE1_34_7]
MTITDIQITFVGMDPTEALKKYVLEKIGKYEHLWKEATGMEVYLKEYINSRGVKNDFRVDITVKLPNSGVRVEVEGENMYANIDEASDTLARRLKRYTERKTYWEGVTPWKVLEADAHLRSIEDEIEDTYEDYVPTIAVRKKIEDMSPLEEGEAIERMELLGYDQLLFRNKNTGKLSMLYKRVHGGYGLVEPADMEI